MFRTCFLHALDKCEREKAHLGIHTFLCFFDSCLTSGSELL